MKVRNYISVGQRCFHCGIFRINHVYLFDGSGSDEKEVMCSGCGKKICTIKRDRKNYIFDVLCGSCGDTHRCVMSIGEALHTPEKKFVCHTTGAIQMVIGTDENIKRIMDKLCDETQPSRHDVMGEVVEIFETVKNAGGAFYDANELFECLEHFKYLSREGRVNCECGESVIQLQVEENGFRIICSSCERDVFLGFNDRDGIERIKKLREIYLI